MTRIPEGIRRQLEREAKKNKRSMNTEIIHRLAQSLVAADVMDLYRQYADIAADATAKKTGDEIIRRLREAIQDDARDSKSLLGNVGRATIIESLSGPEKGEDK
jgi:Arc-like DNA binding domain